MYLPRRKAGEAELWNNTIDVCFGVVHMELGTRVRSKAPIMRDMHACVEASSCELIYTTHVPLTPVRFSTGILARLEAPLDVSFRLFVLSTLPSSSHFAQPVFALVVVVHIAAVALFAGNRCLVLAARGVRHAEVLMFVVLLR